MPIRFSELPSTKTQPKPLEPIALFRSLTVTDPGINDLWLAQGDALRAWDEVREKGDIVVSLNTGAGKTLIGLLMAQSLVNETAGPVFYACSSRQLVQQTAAKATGYGLHATTYLDQEFSDTLFTQGRAPCITTYQALFNGKSRFGRPLPAAVIFDDAHTAAHILRDQFTLVIDRDTFAGPYERLVHLLRSYFSRIRQEMGYLDTLQGQDRGGSRFVPPHALAEVQAELQQVMGDARPGESTSTMFAWEHLKDRLDLCGVFVSSRAVTFTPPVVPTQSLPYFSKRVRRIYLSATLSAEDAFVRAFGRRPDDVVAPRTSAGECERLILIPAWAGRELIASDVTAAQAVIKDRKSLVLVPTQHRGKAWNHVSTYGDERPEVTVDRFRSSDEPQCLVLTGRYDGVDLPGDTCRMLVIDDLPAGLNPLERYLWEQLNLGLLLRSTIASRITQSFGRISRGMSDHGVVVLTGSKLLEWLLAPKNQALLSPFLRQQLMIGKTVSEGVETPDDLVDAATRCLDRDPEWVTFYQARMEEEPDPVPGMEDEGAQTLEMSLAEARYGQAMWDRQYVDAIGALERQLDATFDASRSTGAWHALWLGYGYHLQGDVDQAQEFYQRAHRANHGIPPYDVVGMPDEINEFSSQIVTVAHSLRDGNQPTLRIPRTFNQDLAALDGSGNPTQTEAALQALGEYLGLDATRPDKEQGTGPDVLWLMPNQPALLIEAKTDKQQTSTYSKKDLGQLRDHQRWVKVHVEVDSTFNVFVGPVVPATPESNPDPDMMVIELAQFRDLRDKLRAALTDVCANATPITSLPTVRDAFVRQGLIWPAAYEQFTKHSLIDIPE